MTVSIPNIDELEVKTVNRVNTLVDRHSFLKFVEAFHSITSALVDEVPVYNKGEYIMVRAVRDKASALLTKIATYRNYTLPMPFSTEESKDVDLIPTSEFTQDLVDLATIVEALYGYIGGGKDEYTELNDFSIVRCDFTFQFLLVLLHQQLKFLDHYIRNELKKLKDWMSTESSIEMREEVKKIRQLRSAVAVNKMYCTVVLSSNVTVILDYPMRSVILISNVPSFTGFRLLGFDYRREVLKDALKLQRLTEQYNDALFNGAGSDELANIYKKIRKVSRRLTKRYNYFQF